MQMTLSNMVFNTEVGERKRDLAMAVYYSYSYGYSKNIRKPTTNKLKNHKILSVSLPCNYSHYPGKLKLKQKNGFLKKFLVSF